MLAGGVTAWMAGWKKKKKKKKPAGQRRRSAGRAETRASSQAAGVAHTCFHFSLSTGKRPKMLKQQGLLTLSPYPCTSARRHQTGTSTRDG
jgi:hypothetical protein